MYLPYPSEQSICLSGQKITPIFWAKKSTSLLSLADFIVQFPPCRGRMVVIILPFSLLLVQVSAHGNMKLPYIWQDTAMQGVTTRRTACVDVDLDEPSSDYPNIDGTTKCMNSWFTNHTEIPGEQTIPDSMLTPNKGFPKRKKPWFAPGTAPVHSPCGVWGGNPDGCRSGDPTER